MRCLQKCLLCNALLVMEVRDTLKKGDINDQILFDRGQEKYVKELISFLPYYTVCLRI